MAYKFLGRIRSELNRTPCDGQDSPAQARIYGYILGGSVFGTDAKTKSMNVLQSQFDSGIDSRLVRFRSFAPANRPEKLVDEIESVDPSIFDG